MSVRNDSIADPNKIDWVALTFIASYHVALLIALPLYLIAQTPSWLLIGCTWLLLVTTLLSITAGYHRLFAHRTYKAKKPVEFVLLLFGTLAAQGSALRWAHDHRLHHRHVDGDQDPYGTSKGFWHSHLLWMFKVGKQMDDRVLGDLRHNKMLMFQHRHYGVLLTVTSVGAVLAVGALTGDLIGAFVFAFLLRLFIAHHSTWFINSLAHMWGSKPYSSEHSAVNNFILALLTHGEGYHNYHHTFAGDYRNGVRWYQFDPPKYLIWLMSKIGLTSDLRRTDELMIKKRLVHADLKLLASHLDKVRGIDASVFLNAAETMSQKLSATISSARALMDRYRTLDRKHNRSEIASLRRRFRELKAELSRDLKAWRRLCRLILDLEPAF